MRQVNSVWVHLWVTSENSKQTHAKGRNVVKATINPHGSCEDSSTLLHCGRSTLYLGKMFTFILGLALHVSTSCCRRFIAQNKNILSNEEARLLSNAQQLTYLDETYVTDVRLVSRLRLMSRRTGEILAGK